MKDLKQDIVRVISLQLDVPQEDITEDTDLRNDLNADSLDMTELLMAFEDEFNIEVEDFELGEVVTVRNIVDLLQKKVKGVL